jgi:MOSC domain-containing protein YiiM
MRVRHIFISPGHNYFGHHGQPAGTHPIVEVAEAECVAGQGLRGDRFFGYKDDYRGQLTLFSWEVFQQLCRERGIGGSGLSPAALRRNVIVEGADLGLLVGGRFTLQGIELEGMEECRPCYWMDQAVGPGAEAWLQGRGGLRCRVLSSGWLRVDAVAGTPRRM